LTTFFKGRPNPWWPFIRTAFPVAPVVAENIDENTDENIDENTQTVFATPAKAAQSWVAVYPNRVSCCAGRRGKPGGKHRSDPQGASRPHAMIELLICYFTLY
jgi:hypothetical protein